MNRSRALVPLVAGGLALAGCGSGGKTADNTVVPPPTIAGVGVKTGGPPPKPSTLTACTRRWNGVANGRGRAAAKQRAPKAGGARVRTAGHRGYFRQDAGRCLVYLLVPPNGAVVFVEATPGRFAFNADATGVFSANADVQPDARLRLR